MDRRPRADTAAMPALRGAFTALVTPFTAAGAVDEAAYRSLAEWQVLAGIDGLVPVGTTGEAPTLSAAERDRLIEIAVAAAAGAPSPARPAVVAGTGTNDTRASIEATRRAAALGADAALVVAPYYNRPDQRMLEAHFRAIADEGGLPLVVYNVPSRTGSNVEGRDVPAARRAPAGDRREGGERQPRAARGHLPRPAGGRGRPRRRRRGDAGRARHGRRRRRVRRREPGPGRARFAVCRRASGRLGRGAPDPRALAAPVPGQLPGRAQPGARQGRPARDGPPRARRPAGAAAAPRRRPAGPAGRAAADARPRRRRRPAGRPRFRAGRTRRRPSRRRAPDRRRGVAGRRRERA